MDARRAPAEVSIDASLVRSLLEEQCSWWAKEPLRLVDEGWDNVTYRVGPALAVRLPRRRIAVDLLLNEQRWLPSVAPRHSVAVPNVVFAGVPSEIFPWPWSVVEWIPGTTADERPLGVTDAPRLGEFLLALHRPAPAAAPSNPFRGVPLVERQDIVQDRVARLGLHRLARIWAEGLKATEAEDKVWVHGDLHPRNVIVRDGALAGIIDWGDITAGDAATDLACCWTLFASEASRSAFIEAYQPSATLLARSAAWAVNFAAALLDSGESRHVRIGAFIRERLVGPS